jgi:hypothetical protein
MIFIIPYMSFCFVRFAFYFVFCAFLFFCVLFLIVYSRFFLFVYTFTDHYYRVESQLQLINSILYQSDLISATFVI